MRRMAPRGRRGFLLNDGGAPFLRSTASNRYVGYGRQVKTRPPPRASIPRPELGAVELGRFIEASQPDEGLNSIIISRAPKSLHWRGIPRP